MLFVLLWSTGFIGAKFGLPDAEPLTFLTVRYIAVLALMGAIVWFTRAPWPRTPLEYLHIGISGLLVHAVYLGGVFTAIAALAMGIGLVWVVPPKVLSAAGSH